LQDVKRALLETENELEQMESENAGVAVLKKTNERLYDELTSLQAQIQKLEAMNSSGFSMLNSNLQFNSNLQKVRKSSFDDPGIPEERSDLQLIE
jgi:hypothetical protein